jgi:drug/metabolite transporter (DMT)-like permease
MMIQPVISALLAIPFTGENLAAVQWLGGLAVIFGISLVNTSRRERV